MEIEIFTLADFAQDYSGKLAIMGTFDTIFASKFPAQHPQCSIALRMRFANSETGKYPFTIRIITPDKKDLIKAEGEFDVKTNPNTDYRTINMVLNLTNVKFETPGKYAVELHLNNEWHRGLVLSVLEAEAGKHPSKPSLA